MRRILFVDDEPNVLAGVRRTLHGMRGEWEMAFVEGGEEALAQFREGPFDVIVSDMRMPGMDGAELLRRIKEQYPKTIRFILSGHSEKEMILRSVGLAHQYLTKPCEPEALKAAIQRTERLTQLLQDPSLEQLAAGLEVLPSLPHLFQEIVQELENPNVSMGRLAGIIQKDLGISSKLLQLANSALFALRHPVRSVERAVTVLGLETISGLVLSVKLFETLDEREPGALSASRLQEHCLRTAQLAKALAQHEKLGGAAVDDTFLAALMHDAGRLILAANRPEDYTKVMELHSSQGIRLAEAERAVFNGDHAAVGAYLLGLWGMPDPVIEAVAYHHDPGRLPVHEIGPLTLVHVAAAVSEASEHDPELAEAPEMDRDHLELVGASERVEGWLGVCREVLRREPS